MLLKMFAQSLNKLFQSLNKLFQSLNKLAQSLNKLSQSLNKLAQSLSKLFQQLCTLDLLSKMRAQLLCVSPQSLGIGAAWNMIHYQYSK